MHRPNPSETVSLIPSEIKTSWSERYFPGRNYREAPHMSQGKRNHNLCGVAGHSALMATRTLFSMNDLIGMNLALTLPMRRTVINGNHQQDIYLTDDDRYLFLDSIGQMSERFDTDIFAYVLMSNHYHLLLRTPKANLSRSMQWLGTTYTRRYCQAAYWLPLEQLSCICL